VIKNLAQHHSQDISFCCRHFKVSRSGFYAWKNRPESAREQNRKVLLFKIKSIHSTSRETYGSPRVHATLRKDGVEISENTVAAIMRENKISAKSKRRFKVVTTNSNHNLPVAQRHFQTAVTEVVGPQQVWVGDITYSTPSRSGPAGSRKERTSMNGMRVSTKGVYRHSTVLCYKRA
jgi:putative transposase